MASPFASLSLLLPSLPRPEIRLRFKEQMHAAEQTEQGHVSDDDYYVTLNRISGPGLVDVEM